MEKKCVLVCVTAQKSSTELVKAGKDLADRWNAGLEVVSVLPPNNEDERVDSNAIDAIHDMTRQFGGEMMIFFHDEPVYTLTAYIGKKKPLTVVTGYPGENSNNFINTLRLILPDQEISMVDGSMVYSMLPG